MKRGQNSAAIGGYREGFGAGRRRLLTSRSIRNHERKLGSCICILRIKTKKNGSKQRGVSREFGWG